MSLRLIWTNTAFLDEATYLFAGHVEITSFLPWRGVMTARRWRSSPVRDRSQPRDPVACQRGPPPPADRIPDPDRPVLTDRGQPAATRRHHHRRRPAMTFQRRLLQPAERMPDPDRVILACGSQPSAVRRHGQHRHHASWPFKVASRPPLTGSQTRAVPSSPPPVASQLPSGATASTRAAPTGPLWPSRVARCSQAAVPKIHTVPL